MDDKVKKIEEFKGRARLPEFAIPRHYDLHLSLDLSESCSFRGTEIISLNILEPTSFLVLNALELSIHEVSFTDLLGKEKIPDDVILDGEDEILVLVFKEVLPVGEGVLRVGFSGMLNEHYKGLYKCTFVDKGVRRNMAVTQFEAVDARRCFPCWDEPAVKATFKITLDVPVDLMAFSNMPVLDEKLNGDTKTVYFEKSPVMSTYLVAVVVGLFDHVEATTADGVVVRVHCPVGKGKEGKFALEVAIRSLDMFGRYFSMPYPLPKLDMVAVPEFSGGAMENYGLIVYRENELLYSDLYSTAARKQRLTIVVAHEVAHHWFGNLVTMEWWTHLWLNEGFATWISYLATDTLFSEWNIWNQFLQQTNGGLRLDSQEQTHPIEVDVGHARSVDEIFDDISYKKGSAVIRMLQSYLGDDVFQRSLSSYMRKYAWKNAKTEDLWNVLSEESGVQVDSMMDGWTKKKGYPVISVKSRDHVLEFEQLQFLVSGLQGEEQWIVPITLSIGSYDNRSSFLLESKSEKLDISHILSSLGEGCDKTLWIKINIEQTGFYRVQYDEQLGARLRIAVENNLLTAADKFGILDDAFALCEACGQSLSSLLALMDAYKKELDYIVVSKLVHVCYNVVMVAGDALPESLNDLNEHFIKLLQFSAEKLGWDMIPGESHLSVLLRGEVLMALAAFGDDKTQEEAICRFQAFLKDKNTPLLSSDVRKAAYIGVMRKTSKTDRKWFESLLKVYSEADTVQEKERVLCTIASSPDPDLVLEALEFMVSEEVRDQDVIYGLAGISLEGREIAWEWLKKKWDFIITKYGSLLITHFIRDIIAPLCSSGKADEIESFFKSRVNPLFAMNPRQSIEQVRINARWVQHIKQEESLMEAIKGAAGHT